GRRLWRQDHGNCLARRPVRSTRGHLAARKTRHLLLAPSPGEYAREHPASLRGRCWANCRFHASTEKRQGGAPPICCDACSHFCAELRGERSAVGPSQLNGIIAWRVQDLRGSGAKDV